MVPVMLQASHPPPPPPRPPVTTTTSTAKRPSPSDNNIMFIARRVFKRCRPSDEEEHEAPNAKTVSKSSPTSVSAGTATAAAAAYPPSSPAMQDSSTMLVDTEEYEDSFDDGEDDVSSTEECNDDDEEEANESAPSQTHMHRPTKRYRFDNMPFPEFSSAVEVTDSSSDEESVQQRDEQYRTKEDEDVAVFLNLTKRMSLQSLLHLLQGAARAQNNIIDTSSMASHPMMEYSVLLSGSRRSSRSKNATCSEVAAQPPPGIVKQKKFRFAEISENRVREVVHPIESYKDIPGLWWTNEQMIEIRTDEIRVVKHFRKYRPKFIQSVETLVRANEPPAVLEQHMRHLTEESFARGLETHSVLCIRERRKSHIAAVLQEQDDCREAGDSYELASHCIREQSIAYSQQLIAFAFRMAKCDHIEALKATMSSWETPEAGVFA